MNKIEASVTMGINYLDYKVLNYIIIQAQKNERSRQKLEGIKLCRFKESKALEATPITLGRSLSRLMDDNMIVAQDTFTYRITPKGIDTWRQSKTIMR